MGTDYYANAAAAGGGSGGQADPFTWAEAIAFINAGSLVDGDAMNLQNSGGIFNISDTTITSGGNSYQRKTLRGCTSVANDGGIATLQRTGGSGVLLNVSVWYWLLENLIIDGRYSGTYCLLLPTIVTLGVTKNCEIRNAGTYGVLYGTLENCYIHGCGDDGVGLGNAWACLLEDNKFGASASNCWNCIAKDNSTANFRAYRCSLINCISDGGVGHGVQVDHGAYIVNLIAINSPAGKEGIYFQSPTADRGENNIHNVDFYNCDSNSNALSFIDDYYTLDPQFNEPDYYDYRRTGDNLDDLGFSDIGMMLQLGVDYGVDIGPDQGKFTLPAVGEVKSGVDFGRDVNLSTGTRTDADEDDVRDGEQYGSGGNEFTGNVTLPAEADVRKNTQYGASGSEFTGTLEAINPDPPYDFEGLDYSPAYIIQQYLIGQGKLDDPTGSIGEWPGFVGALPDGQLVDHDAVAVLDTSPVKDGRIMAGMPVVHYGVQILLRATGYNAGYQKISDLAAALASVDSTDVTIESTIYRLYSVTQASDVIVLGQEPGTKRREEFSVNFLVTLRDVT